MVDTRWLTKRPGSNNWYAVKGVPKKLRPLLNGKLHWVKSLETADLVIARSKRHAALAEFAREADAARRQLGSGAIMAEAMAWREHVRRIEQGDLRHVWDGRYAPGSKELRNASLWQADEFIEEDAAEIGRTYGPALADTFRGVATGRATLFLPYLDPWLMEGGKRGPAIPRSQQQYRSIVNRFAAWCDANGVPATVEAVTRRVAGAYVSAGVCAGIDPSTANRHTHTLASFWGWLVRRAGIESNPWKDQTRSVAAARNGERRRSFTDAEVVTLLNGPADQDMRDTMLLALYTGARLDELFGLTVAQCSYGIFDIKKSKSPAGIRTFPIHSELTGLIARRCEGKAPADYLLPNDRWKPGGKRPRSGNMSTRFSKYRRAMGIDDRDPGQRHSKVNLHSARRWFTTKALQAGIDTHVVDDVTGHVKEGLTQAVYSDGASMEQRRQCVESVRLPA